MSREEALTATWVAARAMIATLNLERQSGTPYITVPLHLLTALQGAVESVEAVGEVDSDRPALPPTYWCRSPDCYRVNDTSGVYCYQCSEQAHAPQVRRRDSVFEGAGNE